MTSPIVRPIFREDETSLEKWLAKEWLVTNALGGYSSNSLVNIPTRKYHGVLVAALPEYGRVVMLNHLLEEVVLPDGKSYILNNEDRMEEDRDFSGVSYLEDFYLKNGLPVWIFNFHGVLLEKKTVMTHMQNTTHHIYTLLSESKATLRLYPFIHFRPTSLSVDTPLGGPYKLTVMGNRYEVSLDQFPTLKFFLHAQNPHFTYDEKFIRNVFFRKEARRGYASLGEKWSPGHLSLSLTQNESAGFVASIEDWDEILAMDSLQALEAEYLRRENLIKHTLPEATSSPFGKELILGGDQFIISPESRIQDEVRAHASGDEVRTMIAGYHWFTDWGRDTMISLEGLTLCTGRYEEARWILRTFAFYVKNGLIPNMFPEGQKEGLYNTVDASLWFFHAISRYLDYTQDYDTLQFIMPKLLEIYHAHKRGTLFGIRVDPQDGLVTQGEQGFALTWMDAKVDDWVVTPRRGKAVEINALWYNALRLLETWLKRFGNFELASEVKESAEKCARSFNEKFWNEKKNYLNDVIEGEVAVDDALRPNQLFAFSLEYPVLDKKYWKKVFEICKEALVTPVGLRTLSRDHKDFKKYYDGDLRARDSAYHQGTVWSWLIGPYINAWLKLYPDEVEEAKSYLHGFHIHLREAGIGYISEIFDAIEPYTPRGCIAQAWSMAEIARCLILVHEAGLSKNRRHEI